MKNVHIEKGKGLMKIEDVKRLLEQTYWAKERSIELIEKSMDNSICFGIFEDESNKQIGFARVITDYVTTYCLCDVIVDSEYRGQGLGKMLMEAIHSDKEISDLRGILLTKDAHGLYAKYGFVEGGNMVMHKPRK